MQEVVVEETRLKGYSQPNNPVYVQERVHEYDCTKYCRICPFSGLKCCGAPDAVIK